MPDIHNLIRSTKDKPYLDIKEFETQFINKLNVFHE